MLISKKVNIYRILSGTWRHFFYEIVACVSAYFVYRYVESIHVFDSIIVSSIIPTILGTALAFFIGFNNNQAYDRWWEARKVWGEIVNDSRSWARQIIHFLKPNGGDPLFVNTLKERMVKRHIAFLYALKSNLRKSDRTLYREYLSEEDIAEMEREKEGKARGVGGPGGCGGENEHGIEKEKAMRRSLFFDTRAEVKALLAAI